MVAIVADYKRLFGEPRPAAYRDLIEGILSRFIIALLATVNDALRLKGNGRHTQHFLLSVLSVNFPEELKKKLQQRGIFSGLLSGKFALFAYPYTVEFIFRELMDFREDDGHPFDAREAELLFFKAYLSLVDEMLERETELYLPAIEYAKRGGHNIIKLLWSHLIGQFEFMNHKAALSDAVYERFRGRAFTSYLERHALFGPFAGAFFRSLGCETGEEVTAKLDSFMIDNLQRRNTDAPEDNIYIIRTGQEEPFLEALCLDPEEIRSDPKKQIDYLGLKEKPVFRLKHNEYMVPHWEYYYNAQGTGIIFSFYNRSGIDKKLRSFGDFKSRISTEFAEGILFRRTLEKAFGRKHDVLRFFGGSDTFNPDCYYRHGNKLFIVEFKDYLLASEVIHSSSYDRITEEIEKKFVGYDTPEGRRKGKGVSQIAANLGLLRSGDTFYETDRQAGQQNLRLRNLIVYPVIIHTNKYFELPYLNQYLDKRFQEMLPGESKDAFRSIRPLTIINLQCFFDRLLLFADSKLEWHAEIDHYHDTIKARVKRAERTRDINDWFRSLMPFEEIDSAQYLSMSQYRRGDTLDAWMQCWQIKPPQ